MGWRLVLLSRCPEIFTRRVLLYAACLASSALAGARPAVATAFLEVNRGFCADGSYASIPWPEGKPSALEVWLSYCEAGERDSGSATSAPFPAPPSMALFLSGYPGSRAGVSLELENLQDHSRLAINPHEVPGPRWLQYSFVLPDSWVGRPIRLVAEDTATGPGGWVGFSQPLPAPGAWDLREALTLLVRTISHFLLIFLPAFALCAYALLKGVKDVVISGLIALIGLAAPGYLVFWLYLASPHVGHAVSFLIPILGVASLAYLLPRIGRSGRAVLRALLLPAVLVLLSSLWILSAGFAYGGMRAPLATPWTRFSHPLPPDNMIPYLFAEGVRSSHVSTPLLGNWLSSDRPPLQTGITAAQYPYLPQPRELGYTVLSVLLQSTWLMALWILLVAFQMDRRVIGLVLTSVLFLGFTLVNSFFVWPKLLAAAYIVALCAVLLVDRYAAEMARSRLLCVVAGTLMAFGLLSHGGSVFPLLGIFPAFLLLRRKSIALRPLALMMFTCVVLYSPWMLYQKFYDPPGNHLLKLHLAGVDEVDSRGLAEAIRTSYGKLNLRQWLDAKEQNAMMLVGHESEYWRSVKALVSAVARGQGSVAREVSAQLRGETFFYFSCNLGFPVVGLLFLPAGIRKRHRNRTWRLGLLLWLIVIGTLIPWGLLLFNPGSTSIHAGSYVPVLLAMSGCVLALWSVSPPVAYVATALQILEGVLIYGVFMRQSPTGQWLLEGTLRYGTVTLFFASLLLCCLTMVMLASRSYNGLLAEIAVEGETVEGETVTGRGSRATH